MDFTGIASIAGTHLDLTYTGEFNASVDAGVDQIITGTQLQQNANIRETMKDGEVWGFRKTDARRSLTINFFPTAVSGGSPLTSGGLAMSKKALELPAIPSKVVISNSVLTGTGTDPAGYDGDWVYLGGGSRSTSEDVVQMTLPLVQFTSSPRTATQLTTAIT